MEKDYGKTATDENFSSLFKLGVYGGSLLFTGIFIYADFIILFLLGDQYGNSIFYLQLFAVMNWIIATNQIMHVKVSASGSRKKVTYSGLALSVFRITYLTIATFFDSIIALIIAKILVFISMFFLLLSFDVINLKKTDVAQSMLIGSFHLLIASAIFFSFPNLILRTVISLIVGAFSILFAFRFRFISEKEIMIIQKVLRKG